MKHIDLAPGLSFLTSYKFYHFYRSEKGLTSHPNSEKNGTQVHLLDECKLYVLILLSIPRCAMVHGNKHDYVYLPNSSFRKPLINRFMDDMLLVEASNELQT